MTSGNTGSPLLEYQAPPRRPLWRCVLARMLGPHGRSSSALLAVQTVAWALCECEAENYGRFIHLGSDRYHMITTLRIELASGRGATYVLVLGVANLLYVSLAIPHGRGDVHAGRAGPAAFFLATLPLLLQLGFFLAYAEFCYE